jgi:hypothetical protein
MLVAREVIIVMTPFARLWFNLRAYFMINAAAIRCDLGRHIKPNSRPREAIAYHEAGHAVVSMTLGYKCLYATIIPDGDRLGHVCCEDPLIGGHDDKIKHALKVLIAARLAEGRHVGSQTWGDADDRVKATNLALLATDRDTERAEALLNEMVGEARKLVEKYWPDIEELADQLLIEGRVNFLQTERGIERERCHQYGSPPRPVLGRAPRWSILSKG